MTDNVKQYRKGAFDVAKKAIDLNAYFKPRGINIVSGIDFPNGDNQK